MNKKIFLCLFSVLFLTGCTFNNKTKNKLIERGIFIKENPNEEKLIIDENIKNTIYIVDEFPKLIDNFKLCVPSQFFEKNNNFVKNITIIGSENNNCSILFYKNNFESNLKCLFDKKLLEDAALIENLYYTDDYTNNEILKNNCFMEKIEENKFIIDEELMKNAFIIK